MADERPRLVFDFGGVLITSITEPIAEIAAWHGVAMIDMLELLMGPRETSTPDHPWHRAERGELAVDEMQGLLAPWAEAVGIELTGGEYERLLRGDFEVHHDIVAHIGELRSQGYITALLTNSFAEFEPVREERIDHSVFDHVFDSAFMGWRKPEPQIYRAVTDELDVAPSQIVYLDDFAANLSPAAELGWRTIQVNDPAVAMAELSALLAADT